MQSHAALFDPNLFPLFYFIFDFLSPVREEEGTYRVYILTEQAQKEGGSRVICGTSAALDLIGTSSWGYVLYVLGESIIDPPALLSLSLNN